MSVTVLERDSSGLRGKNWGSPMVLEESHPQFIYARAAELSAKRLGLGNLVYWHDKELGGKPFCESELALAPQFVWRQSLNFFGDRDCDTQIHVWMLTASCSLYGSEHSGRVVDEVVVLVQKFKDNPIHHQPDRSSLGDGWEPRMEPLLLNLAAQQAAESTSYDLACFTGERLSQLDIPTESSTVPYFRTTARPEGTVYLNETVGVSGEIKQRNLRLHRQGMSLQSGERRADRLVFHSIAEFLGIQDVFAAERERRDAEDRSRAVRERFACLRI